MPWSVRKMWNSEIRRVPRHRAGHDHGEWLAGRVGFQLSYTNVPIVLDSLLEGPAPPGPSTSAAADAAAFAEASAGQGGRPSKGPDLKGRWYYRFSIAFENSSTPGYTTEQIVHALAADTIPIYWENPEIGREFNPRRFINCHEFPNANAVVDRVRQIDRDDGLFREIPAEPLFPANRIPESLQDEMVLAQFARISSQTKEKALHRNRFVWGRRYEERRASDAQAWTVLERVLTPYRRLRTSARRWLRFGRWAG